MIPFQIMSSSMRMRTCFDLKCYIFKRQVNEAIVGVTFIDKVLLYSYDHKALISILIRQVW